MIVVFVAGLWTTVRLGQSLHAPHDISGKWLVADAPGESPKVFAISQSGRFVKLKVDSQKPIDLVLASDTVAETGRQMTFAGDGQSLSVWTVSHDRATDRTSPYRFEFQGPVAGAYTATRDEAAETDKKSAKH
ncbi:MAG: hypothetical protein QM754_05250 [Tepidisphaeraceae bacterium]